MNSFYMPTKVIFDDDCLNKVKQELAALGQACYIITGKTSAIKSGALKELLCVLNELEIKSYVFDGIMENPTIEVLDEAMTLIKDKEIDWICGIGGGSPLDAAKMIGVLAKHRELSSRELLTRGDLSSIPVVAIPTTSGTGSETTPYSVVTDHLSKNKVTCKPHIFPTLAVLDPKYYMSMPRSVVQSTGIDALCHLVEGFLVKNSSLYSDITAKAGLAFFKEAKEDLLAQNFTKEMHENLIHASMLAGITISQSGTGIPHGMGYYLTYWHNVAHGKATGLFLASLVELHMNKEHPKKSKALEILDLLGFKTLPEFRTFISRIIGSFTITEEELKEYTLGMSKNKRKLSSHEFIINFEDLEKAFRDSLTILKTDQ